MLFQFKKCLTRMGDTFEQSADCYDIIALKYINKNNHKTQ